MQIQFDKKRKINKKHSSGRSSNLNLQLEQKTPSELVFLLSSRELLVRFLGSSFSQCVSNFFLFTGHTDKEMHLEIAIV